MGFLFFWPDRSSVKAEEAPGAMRGSKHGKLGGGVGEAVRE